MTQAVVAGMSPPASSKASKAMTAFVGQFASGMRKRIKKKTKLMRK